MILRLLNANGHAWLVHIQEGSLYVGGQLPKGADS